MISEELFEKYKFEIMMITNIRIGIIPQCKFSRLHPMIQRDFLREIKNYLQTVTDETMIVADFQKYFRDDRIVQKMKMNHSEYDYGDLDSVLSDRVLRRPMYPTKSCLGPW